MNNRWLSMDDTAAYFRIKRETLYKWLSEKDVPAYKVGNLWKFRKDKIDQGVTSGVADSRKMK